MISSGEFVTEWDGSGNLALVNGQQIPHLAKEHGAFGAD